MAPNIQVPGRVPEVEDVASPIAKDLDNHVNLLANDSPKLQIVWRNVLLMLYLHMAAVYGLYLCWTSAKWQTTTTGNLFEQLSNSLIQ